MTKHGGGFKASESPDGKFVYYTQYNDAGIYRVPVEGGEETLVIDSYKAGWGNWAVVDDGVYFIKQDSSGEATIKFFNFATQQVLDVVALGKVTLHPLALAVSPDRQWLLYTRVDQGNIGNITLVENFR